jgi:L-threonylcarbamoyladenylate synthase
MPCSNEDDVNDIAKYVSLLRQGRVIACPTETLFGLLADAMNPAAVARVCEIKRRQTKDPIAVLVPSIDAARRLVAEFPDEAVRLARQYWPGPLTLVLRAAAGLPEPLVLDGKIGIRAPGPSAALDIVTAFDGPLTATSANRAGAPAAVTAEQVLMALGDEVDAIVPGLCPGGAPSTLLDVTETPPRVLRKGAVRIDS